MPAETISIAGHDWRFRGAAQMGMISFELLAAGT
jgi:hypothetical protein